jgi:serine/threonine-protein kinase
MNVEWWTQLNRLLDEALDLPPADREQWLANLGPGNDALKTRLCALLAHASSVQASSFLAAPSGGSPVVGEFVSESGQPLFDQDAEQTGALIGRYRLLRSIGAGGMGVVWLAERADGLFQRQVALKLPRGTWPRADLVERMARERDILAALTHANIARLYDAGITTRGGPYLALEYVEGRTIDAYCAGERLDVAARVRLFLQVVDAVAYAHARLVVHRDLKPSNILVTKEGQIRLLDFGIAKLLEEESLRDTRLTEISGRPHTPEYASPEQIAGGPLGVATDVYSLGVVLYELLCGARPYKPRHDSVGALETAVLEADPVPPSAAANDRSRRRALRGDLDTIVLKALQKQPAARYATVNALGDDLECYLTGRPVLARPDSAWYRFSKFIRRNALGAGATAAVIVGLAAFGVVSNWQARVLSEQRRIAQTERDTAEQVVRLLIDLFETTNPAVRPDGERMPVGEFLAGAESRSLELLRSTPAVRARLQQVFGLIHQTRGQYAQARLALDEALTEQRRQRGPDDPESLASLQALGELASLLDDNDRARALLEESLERHRRVYGEQHERTARVMHALAPIVMTQDQAEGERLLVRALEIRRATLAPNDPVLAENLSSLAAYYRRRDEYDRARRTYQQALAVWPTVQDRRHPNAIAILNDYATLLSELNEHTEAETLQREAIETGQQVLGAETLTVANLLNNLGVTESFLGRHSEAERLYRESHQTHRSLVGERHWRTANVARNVGRSLALQQRYEEAVPWMNEAIAALSSIESADLPSGPTGLFGMRAQRGLMLYRLSHRQDGIAQAAAAVADLERLQSRAPNATRTLVTSKVILGRMLNDSGRPRDAEPILSTALAGVEMLGPQHPQYAEALCELTRARLLQGPSTADRERLGDCLQIYRNWGLAEREVVAALDTLLATQPRERVSP